MSHNKVDILNMYRFTGFSLMPGMSARRLRFEGRCRARVVWLSSRNDEGIRGISTRPVVRLGYAVDLLAFLFPRREEIGGEDVTDVVMHHVEIIKNVRDLGILGSELRAQFLRHGHEGPFHGRLVKVTVIGAEDGLYGFLL